VNSGESPSIVDPVVESPGGVSYQPPATTPAIINPDNPPWGALAAFGTWFGSIIFLIFVPIFTALPYMVYAAARGTGGPSESFLADKNLIFFSVLGVFPAHLLTLGFAWLIVTRAGRYPFWETLGWKWPANFGPWKSVGIALLLLGIGMLITYFVGGKTTQLDELINSSYRTRVTTAILAATTAPLVEEVVYRGVLYSAFKRAVGVFASVVIVSILFAGVHVAQYRSNIGVIAVISILSISLTVVRAYSGSLLPSFIIHFVFNGIQSVLLVIQPFIEKSEQVMPEKVPAHLIASFLRLIF